MYKRLSLNLIALTRYKEFAFPSVKRTSVTKAALFTCQISTVQKGRGMLTLILPYFLRCC